MRLPVPGPRDLMSALERGSEQVEALLGAVPRALALLDRADEVVVIREGRVVATGGHRELLAIDARYREAVLR